MSETEKNLLEALKGESLAIQKYRIFAKIAKKEGNILISNVFLETAKNEEQHAKELFKMYLKIVGKKMSTKDCLEEAVNGEDFEHLHMYSKMAKKAKEEGKDDAAKLFSLLSNVEKTHSERYNKMLKLLESKKLYKKDEKIVWECLECGHQHTGTSPPEKCPLCNHSKEYFKPTSN